MHKGKALLLRRDVSLPGASGSELYWGLADLGPDVAQKSASLCASCLVHFNSEG